MTITNLESTCATCNGTRKVKCEACGGSGTYNHGGYAMKCKACSGTGEVNCPTCR